MSTIHKELTPLVAQYQCSFISIVPSQGEEAVEYSFPDSERLAESLTKHGLLLLLETMTQNQWHHILLADEHVRLELFHHSDHFVMIQHFEHQKSIHRTFQWHATEPKRPLSSIVPVSSKTSEVQSINAAGSDGEESVALGSEFCSRHGVAIPYVAGAMAGGIASVALVQAMSRAGMLAFFGSGGLALSDIETALETLSKESGIWGCNLLHNVHQPEIEMQTVDLLLRYGVRYVSASAFMTLSKALVRYRVSGIYEENGVVHTPNKVFAKVSHSSVLQHFLSPPPLKYLEELHAEGVITADQKHLAQRIPMAEDVTIESDSGGHTDGRPLMSIFPAYKILRDEACTQYSYASKIRLGAAGGMGDPSAIRAAFSLGADYVLLGSIHQCTLEAGTSDMVKAMLAEATVLDCGQAMAPDMFEQGSHVQVLTKGTMYAQRSKRLFQLYRSYDSIESIPSEERDRIERTIFRCSLDSVWVETQQFWQRDLTQLERAERDPKHKMALIFRWYLGQSSRWARLGVEERKRDFQIWCGPAIGAFNGWAKNRSFADWRNRRIVDVVHALWAEVIQG
jgi:PfaD family protein